jgi:hypothetical protein
LELYIRYKPIPLQRITTDTEQEIVMKTFRLIALFAAAAAAASFAQNTVSSGNIVGYQKVSLRPAGYYIPVGSAFESDSGTPTLISIFGTNQLAQGASPALCDRVYVWDKVNQVYLTFAQKLTTRSFYSTTNWTGASADNYPIPLGSAVWVQSKSSSTTTNDLVLSGSVPVYSAITNSILGGSGRPLSFICNPYPAEININNLINTNNGATAGATPALGDIIYLWNETTQQYVGLALKSSDNMWHYTTNWAGSAANVTITPSQGFWYGAKKSFTWIQNRPFDIN